MVMIPRKDKAKADEAAKAPAAQAPNQQAPAEKPAVAVHAGQQAGPAATSDSTEVAVQATRAVSTRLVGKPRRVIEENYKDAFKVDWNTLHRIQGLQGAFVDVENNKNEIGKSLTMELLSYQDNYQISPGTDVESDAQYVRYSDDGVTTTQGESCAEHLAALKEAGYNDAKMSKRTTLAGILHKADDPAMVGTMVQIDLPPTSKNMFDRYQLQSSLDVARGVRTEDQLGMIKMTAKVATKGRMSWTVVEFEYAD